MSNPTAHLQNVVVTGASSGIGAATVRLFQQRGFRAIGVARRADKLAELAAETGAHTIVADLTNAADISRMVSEIEALGGASVLVNNAGGAFGLDRIEDGTDELMRKMFEINVFALRNVTAAMLPVLRAGVAEAGVASIINITSIAAKQPYQGGGGYNAAKYAARALTEVLRLELGGEPIRVIEVAPGMVHTEEFALNRFAGDSSRADAVYEGVAEPLLAQDIAEAVVHAASLPPRVSCSVIEINPVAQASVYQLARGELRVR